MCGERRGRRKTCSETHLCHREPPSCTTRTSRHMAQTVTLTSHSAPPRIVSVTDPETPGQVLFGLTVPLRRELVYPGRSDITFEPKNKLRRS